MDDLHDPPIVVLHEILDYMFWCTFRESLLISDVFGNALYHKDGENTHIHTSVMIVSLVFHT